MVGRIKALVKKVLRVLIGSHVESLHEWAYQKKLKFRKTRIRVARELKLLLRGFSGGLAVSMSHPFNRIFGTRFGLPKFLIGPTNSANQASEWARALTAAGAQSQSLRISADPSAEWFSTDIATSREEWLKFPNRQKLAERIASESDIVLLESLRPILRLENVRDGRHQAMEDIQLLDHIGKEVGVVFHGSDIRDVDAHAARIPFSPFRVESPESEVGDLRKRSNENRALLPWLKSEGIPLFVTTTDLLTEVPTAHWLPIVINFNAFEAVAKSSPLYSAEKVRVLFLPSRSWLKSANLITPVLQKLDAEGVIEWVRTAPVPHDQIPSLMAKCDVVVDQFLGVVGVLPIEALAAGRVVMSYVPDSYVGERPPIISITPETFEAELRRVAIERPLSAGGVEYAKKWHDGRESVRVIGKAFGWKLG